MGRLTSDVIREQNWQGKKLTTCIVSVLYLLVLVGVLFDLSFYSVLFSGLADFLLKHLWGSVAGIILAPLMGLCLFPSLAGPIAFNQPGRFQRLRLVISCLALAALYLIGNSLHYRRNQWMDLHFCMCCQLLSTGREMPAARPTNWIAFGVLVLAYIFHYQTFTWSTLDYVWGTYFVFLAFAARFVQLKNSAAEV